MKNRILQGSLSSATIWVIIFILIVFLFVRYTRQAPDPQRIPLLDWIAKADNQLIASAVDRGGTIEGEYWGDASREKKMRYKTEYLPGQEGVILQHVIALRQASNRGGGDSAIPYDPRPKNESIIQTIMLSVLLPMLLVIGLWLLLMRQLRMAGWNMRRPPEE